MFFSHLETLFKRDASRAVVCWACALWFVALAGTAQTVDKMVAVVDSHIITLSDVRKEREIRTRLGEKPQDDDRALIREMIDDYLIELQSANFPGVDVTADEIDAELKNSPAQAGPAPAAIREAAGRRIRMQKYFDLRFRQFIRPSDEDVQKYYDEVFVPEAKKRGLDPIPALAQITDAVRTNVIQEQMNHEIDIWLEAIRTRSNIEVFE